MEYYRRDESAQSVPLTTGAPKTETQPLPQQVTATVAAKKILKELNIRLIAEDTGLDYGRTVELRCETGELYIKAVRHPVKII